MKKTLYLLLLSTLATSPLLAQTIEVNKQNRTIAVTATDSASAPADLATISLGYRIYAPDAPTAYATGSKISNAVIKALTDAGIDKKRIQSSDQKLTETTDFPISRDDHAARRYNLAQSWTVQTPAEDAAKVLNIAVVAGANESGHIDWSLVDDNALQAKAAEMAMKRANDVAASMAKGLGAKLGPLVYASNQAPEGNNFDARSAQIGTLIDNKLIEDLPVSPLAITTNKIEKSATVYAVFAIE